MTLLEVLDTKISDLNKMLGEIKNSNLSEKQKLEAELVILNECENILANEELIRTYDFTKVVGLLQNNNLAIDNLQKLLIEVQQVIEVRKMANLPNLPFTESQITALAQLKINLEKAKSSLSSKILEAEKSDEGKVTIDNLEELKSILSGTGKRKYYTTEMLDSLSEVVDWENISDDEFDSIISGFYTTKNLQGRQNKEKENIDNVIALYKEFLDKKEFEKNSNGKFTGLFAALIFAYSDEITSYIDLDNTREILQFFKDNNILENFGRNALLKVSLFANSDYVKKLYDNIKKEHPDEMDIYFEDELATLWVCDSTFAKRNPFRITRGSGEKDGEPSLYSQCHSVTEDEFRLNVKYLAQNASMFDDKFNVANFGAHLKAKTLPEEEVKNFLLLLKLVTSSSWAFRKNLNLLKTFKMGEHFKIPVSSLEKGDAENKIHLAIELGLLNSPMDRIYRELDKDIETNTAFQKIPAQKNIQNNSIRNYFPRNISVLSSLDVNDYGFLTYKLDTLGPVDFYNYFFHQRKTGQRDKGNIEEDMARTMPDKDEFIREKFITDFYDQYIDNYDEYDIVISNYNESIKSSTEENDKYFKENILNEDLIKKLEQEHCIMDELTQGEDTVELKNEFVYKFGDKLISRYKVLHNATILRDKYGYLDENMLLTSVVRNSFLNEETFKHIKDSVKERSKIK